jgi:phage shock protein PspC (stress-responsive transcriptional regulator)
VSETPRPPDPAPGEPPLGGGDPLREEPERPAPPASSDPPPRRLTRSSTDRLLGGVAGGLGRHFAVDPLAFRIAFVVLTFAGGFGVLAYLVGLVAMPADDDADPMRWGLARTVGAGLLAVAAFGALAPDWLWGPELPILAVAGVVIYLLVRVIRDDGGSHAAGVAARVALGIALTALAAAGFAAAAAGSALGGGVLVAGLVIALGVALIGGAFRGGARWLIVPAFVLALPLGVVSAADLELNGTWGERTFRPADVRQVADGYEMGAGHMQVDLRGLELPPGRTELPLRIGAGEIEVAVPDDACVTYDVEVSAGEVQTLDAVSDGGVDLHVTSDAAVPAGVPELHVRADVGVGAVIVGPGFGDAGWRDWREGEVDLGFMGAGPLNTACREAS